MTLDTFLTFLTFLTQKLVRDSARREGSEIPPYARRGRPGPRTPEFVSEAMAHRQRLPNRHGHELLDFEHGGIRYTVGAGWFEDGRLAEIFLSTAKHGTAVDVNARDAAVAASLLLQHGCPVDTLRRALTRNSDGAASGPLAHALDLLAEGT
jgi:ribonucleoside-diphosphate reductase alpha chain